MTLAHTNAVVARITSIPALSAKTFRLVAPRDGAGKLTALAPYVVVQPMDGIDTAERFTGPRITQHPHFVLHIVGSSYDNAQTVTELVKDKFVVPGGFAIQFTSTEIPGQTGKHLYWSAAQPTQVDNDVTPPMIYNTVELGWTSDPI